MPDTLVPHRVQTVPMTFMEGVPDRKCPFTNARKTQPADNANRALTRVALRSRKRDIRVPAFVSLRPEPAWYVVQDVHATFSYSTSDGESVCDITSRCSSASSRFIVGCDSAFVPSRKTSVSDLAVPATTWRLHQSRTHLAFVSKIRFRCGKLVSRIRTE